MPARKGVGESADARETPEREEEDLEIQA